MERKFLSRETANALKTIRNIIEKFPEYGVVDLFGMYSPKDVIWSIVALSRLQHVLETSEPRNKESTVQITDKQLLDELAYYCAFANAAYGWKGFAFCGRLHLGGDYRVLARSTGIDRRDIITANWSSKANRPAYYIARDVKRKAIVLAIRGSFSPRDILTDLCASCENFIVEDELQIGEIGYYRNFTTPQLRFGRAHKGMVDAARTISAMTGKIVSDELDAHPDYKLVIVGHSLGGGVAAIIAAMWQRRFRNRVRSIGYGNPCVFPLNVTKVFDNIITVQVCGDPFATISLGHLADSTKAVSKLCQDKGMRDGILKRLDDPMNISRDDFEWCSNAMMLLRRQMDSEKLYPPGMIYQVSGPLLDFQASSDEKKRNGQGEGVLSTLTSTDATSYSEMKLHASMFDVSLHIPMRYEMLLRRLASIVK